MTLDSTNPTKNMSSYFTINAPSHVDDRHFQEWLNSGVSELIISLTITSVHDSQELDKILNRNNRRRQKHSDNLIPAWCVSGINPQGWERTLEGVQVKSDNPQIINGKPQKYLSASGYGVSPLFLDVGIPDYWLKIIEDKSIPITIVEGAKKAGAVLTLGKAAISIPGVSTCRKKGRLHKLLQLFCGYGRTFYLGFDNDLMTKKPVQNALLNLSRDLSATGSKVMVLEFPPGDAKGADDFIVTNGKEAFENLYPSAKTIEEWQDQVKQFWLLEQEKIKETKKSKLARFLHIIKLGWGDGLRFNSLKNRVEMGGEPFDLEQVRLRIALEFDMDVPSYDAISIVDVLAKQQSYHPVQEYLEDVAEQYPNPDLSILDNLASRYLGSQEILHDIYMRKTLIAAVARIYEPGCQHDAATIFTGKQYAGKSSFWRKLFGEEFFSDQLGEATKSEDELAKVHQFWGLEWAEFETVYRKKDVASLKKFMSARVDAFRLPYARTTKEYPRQSILVGTSNEEEILNDPTGSRRFWIIPVSVQSIPLDLLEKERDLLWAAAYHAYQNGEKWELDLDDRIRQAELNKDFQTQDPWFETIQTYIRGKIQVNITDLFYHLSIEPSRQDISLTKRVAAILRQLNWASVRKYVNGAWSRFWEEVKTKVTFSNGSSGSSQNSVSFDTLKNDHFSKVENVINSNGSSGSSQNSVSFDTLKNDHFSKVENVINSNGSSGSSQNDVAHYTVSNNFEFVRDRVDNDSGQGFQKNNSQLDPLDPLKNQTFIDKQNSEKIAYQVPSVQSEVTCPRTGLPLPQPFEVKIDCPLGTSTCLVTPLKIRKKDNRIECRFEFEFANGTTSRKFGPIIKKDDAEKLATKEISDRTKEAIKHPSRRYSVFQIVGEMLNPEVIWVEGCVCTEVPEHPINSWWVFRTPVGDRIQVAGDNEFKLER
ncbi:MAG: DUF3854 domain-containing protein [Tolypothrix brevis GSE-NOS-MK-07-07A]|jgi:predicted P-loop ATPase|nr:DUF3854 domain-containing protein [Tolypothrix brevis GSE-NOS-MK-07-07A]